MLVRRGGRWLGEVAREGGGASLAAPAAVVGSRLVVVVAKHDRVAAPEHAGRVDLRFTLDESTGDEEEEVLDACQVRAGSVGAHQRREKEETHRNHPWH